MRDRPNRPIFVRFANLFEFHRPGSQSFSSARILVTSALRILRGMHRHQRRGLVFFPGKHRNVFHCAKTGCGFGRGTGVVIDLTGSDLRTQRLP